MLDSALIQDNPFLVWVLSLENLKAVELRNSGAQGAVKDIILNSQAARRFGVGVHNQIPYLGYTLHDKEAIESVRWSSAALLFDKQGGDWIALSCLDSRTETSTGINPVPIRLFIPVTSGRMSLWKDMSPSEISIGLIKNSANNVHTFDISNEPFKTLPLKIS